MRQELTRRLERPGLRFGRLPVSSRLCLVILVLVALAAIFAPLLSRYSPTQTVYRSRPLWMGLTSPSTPLTEISGSARTTLVVTSSPGCSMELAVHLSSAWAPRCWPW